jgi:hypothetical protein
MFLGFILWNLIKCNTQYNSKKAIATNLQIDAAACHRREINLTSLDSKKPAHGLGGIRGENQQISADRECLDGLPICQVGGHLNLHAGRHVSAYQKLHLLNTII